MDNQKKYRLIAGAVAVLLFAGMLLWLIFTRLSFVPPDGSEWPPAPDTTAVLLADEYVEVMPVLPDAPGGGEDEGAEAPPPEALDVVDAGAPADAPAQQVTSPLPSPVKAPKPKPQEKTGPEKSATPDATAKEAPKPDTKKEAASRWGKGSQKGGEGTGESDKGTGAGSGSSKGKYRGSGSGNLGGRKVSVSTDGIDAPNPGKVVVTITVDPQGKVVEAKLKSGGGYSNAVTSECLRRARSARVTPKSDAPDRQSGDITFTFK